MAVGRDQVRVVLLEASSSGAIAQAITDALVPYPPDAILHVSHAITHKPSSSIVTGSGEATVIYSALLLIREPTP